MERLKKHKKLGLRILVVVLSVFAILYTAVFFYVSANKEKIISEVTTEISKRLNGKVTIKSVDLSFLKNFPKISVVLHGVNITDTMYYQHKHTFFACDVVYAQLSITKLIRRQSPLYGIKVEDGSFYLFTDTLGYSNKYLLAAKKSAIKAAPEAYKRNELSNIDLKNIRFTIDDMQKGKLQDFQINHMGVDLDDEEEESRFAVKADILVHSMAFKTFKGSYIKEKVFKGDFDMKYDRPKKQLVLDSIEFSLNDQPFNLSGRFDMSGTAPQFNMRIHTKDIPYGAAKSLVTPAIARSMAKIELDRPIDADATITGPLKGGEPLVYASWKVKNTHLVTPLIEFDSASFTGFFSNEVVAGLPRFDPNSRIMVNGFTASWHGLPVSSNTIDILDLSTPTLSFAITSAFPLTKLNEIIGGNSVQMSKGDGNINVIYKGPLDDSNTSFPIVDGLISFTNASMMYMPRSVTLDNLNGRILLKNGDAVVDNIQCDVLNNKILMNGVAKNLLNVLVKDSGKVNVDWNISSPALNMGAFMYLLKPANKTAVTNQHKKASVAALAQTIDDLLHEGKLNVELNAGRMSYKTFDATNVSASLSIVQDSYFVNNISLNHGGGHMNFKGAISPARGNAMHTSFSSDIVNVDVKRLFASFDNFGQDGITSENLEGRLTAKIDGNLTLNEFGKVNPASLNGIINFSLKDGALNNYEPVKKLQNFIFKKRDFENIRFAELKDKLELANQEIKINRMEIQSSVLSMYVEGVYSPKGKTDMSIQVPLNNLKKRATDYNPENIGLTKKVGTSIFLRGQPGSDGNIKFKLDLFKKYNKAKNAAEVKTK